MTSRAAKAAGAKRKATTAINRPSKRGKQTDRRGKGKAGSNEDDDEINEEEEDEEGGGGDGDEKEDEEDEDDDSGPGRNQPKRKQNKRRICGFCANDPMGISMARVTPCDWVDGKFTLECTNCANYRHDHPDSGHQCCIPRKKQVWRRYADNDPDNYSETSCDKCSQNGFGGTCDVDTTLGYSCRRCGKDECRVNDQLMEFMPNLRQGFKRWARHACDVCSNLAPRKSQTGCSWLQNRKTWDKACTQCRDGSMHCIDSGEVVAAPIKPYEPEKWEPQHELKAWNELRGITPFRKNCLSCVEGKNHCRSLAQAAFHACNKCFQLGISCVDASEDRTHRPLHDLSRVGFGHFMPFTSCQRCTDLGRNCDRQRPCDSCCLHGEEDECDNYVHGSKDSMNCLPGRLDPPPGPLYYLAHGYGAEGVNDIKDGSELEHWIGPAIPLYALPHGAALAKMGIVSAAQSMRSVLLPEKKPPTGGPNSILSQKPVDELTVKDLREMILEEWPEAKNLNEHGHYGEQVTATWGKVSKAIDGIGRRQTSRRTLPGGNSGVGTGQSRGDDGTVDVGDGTVAQENDGDESDIYDASPRSVEAQPRVNTGLSGQQSHIDGEFTSGTQFESASSSANEQFGLIQGPAGSPILLYTPYSVDPTTPFLDVATEEEIPVDPNLQPAPTTPTQAASNSSLDNKSLSSAESQSEVAPRGMGLLYDNEHSASFGSPEGLLLEPARWYKKDHGRPAMTQWERANGLTGEPASPSHTNTLFSVSRNEAGSGVPMKAVLSKIPLDMKPPAAEKDCANAEFKSCMDPGIDCDQAVQMGLNCSCEDHSLVSDSDIAICESCARASADILVDETDEPITKDELVGMRAYLCNDCTAHCGNAIGSLSAVWSHGAKRIWGCTFSDGSEIDGSLTFNTNRKRREADGSCKPDRNSDDMVLIPTSLPASGCSCATKIFQHRLCRYHRLKYARQVMEQVATMIQWRRNEHLGDVCPGCLLTKPEDEANLSKFAGDPEPNPDSETSLASWICMVCNDMVINQKCGNSLVPGWENWFSVPPQDWADVGH